MTNQELFKYLMSNAAVDLIGWPTSRKLMDMIDVVEDNFDAKLLMLNECRKLIKKKVKAEQFYNYGVQILLKMYKREAI